MARIFTTAAAEQAAKRWLALITVAGGLRTDSALGDVGNAAFKKYATDICDELVNRGKETTNETIRHKREPPVQKDLSARQALVGKIRHGLRSQGSGGQEAEKGESAKAVHQSDRSVCAQTRGRRRGAQPRQAHHPCGTAGRGAPLHASPRIPHRHCGPSRHRAGEIPRR